MSRQAFHAVSNTIKIAASTASTNMALAVTGASPQVQISNVTTAYACCTFGGATVTTTMPTTADSAPGYMIPNGESRVVTPGLATYMAVSLVSGTGSIFATAGSET